MFKKFLYSFYIYFIVNISTGAFEIHFMAIYKNTLDTFNPFFYLCTLLGVIFRTRKYFCRHFVKNLRSHIKLSKTEIKKFMLTLEL